MGRAGVLLMGAGLLLAAPLAHAGNGTKPRIPVDWSGAPCMTIVDRSVTPELHIEYQIPQEDIDLTKDEVVDSRTHQFFALCRSHDPQSFLPRWITQDDIDRATLVDAAPPSIEPEDVFETSREWAGCWERINADDDRRPITEAAAAAGVNWDTTAAPAGTYVLEGYTWEPALNIWSRRPGVVKVVDQPELSASGPALAVTNEEEVINKNESVVLEGCVSAMEGSTITGYWGMADDEVDWQPFIEDDPVSGETFAVELSPPEELSGESVMVRIDVEDPMGRSYTNYMYELVIILGSDGPGCSEGGGGFIGGAGCSDDTGSDDTGGSDDAASGTTGATEDTGSATTTPAADDGSDGGLGREGCSCRASGSGRGAPVALGLGLLGLLGWRRRSIRP